MLEAGYAQALCDVCDGRFDELRHLHHDITAVIDRYRHTLEGPGATPAEARERVQILLYGFPVKRPK